MDAAVEKFTSSEKNAEKSHFFPDGMPGRKSPKKHLRPEPQSQLPTWFWGLGPAFAKLKEDLNYAVKSKWNVLVVGETGTGKELIARYIHESRLNASKDTPSLAQRPFVAVNCATIPDSLAESLLFGHEKGAFTSARSRQKGKFEHAQQGTLFLDEIQAFPLSVQSKLLRVVQSKEIEPLGGHRTLTVGCHLVAATNIPLEILVEQKRFRKDLYFRLNTCPLYLPPLRERLEDLPNLIRGLLSEIRKKTNSLATSLSANAYELFLSYKWPGNIRELENALHYASMRSQETIDVQHLPPSLTGELTKFLKEGLWDL